MRLHENLNPSFLQRIALLAGAALMALPCAWAGPHVHGELHLGVAVDGETVTLDFHAPLDSLLGFERAPRTADEKARVQRWDGLLRAPAAFLRFDEAAVCTLRSAEVNSPIRGLGDLVSPSTDGHAEVEGAWVFTCRHPEALKSLRIALFEPSRSLQRIRVVRVGPGGARQLLLKRPDTLIPLVP